MSAPRTLARFAVLAAALLLLAAALAATGARPRNAHPAATGGHARYPDHFPSGPGEDIAARSCVICHSAMLVTQQAKDSLGWEKTLSLMEKWGAPVAAAEHDSLRTYLLTRFGAKPANH
jgi:hypothetical protein